MRGRKLKNLSPLKKSVGIIRHLGPRWIAFRIWHAGRMRAGTMARRDPIRPWSARPGDAGFLTMAPRVLAGLADFEKLSAMFSSWDAAAAEPPVKEGVALLAGRFRYFGWRRVELGRRPAWQSNPLTGESVATGLHWSQIADFAQGDIKLIWEASRWGWALDLARAFARTGDRRFAGRFRQLRNDWMAANPPGAGPNWKCGQEASLRLIAACIATAILACRGQTNASGIRQLVALAEATAQRIEANLDYALSQDNNHGLSELAGLLTVAVLFPDLPEARERRRRARLGLIRELNRLVAADGSFAQYSTNYHRVLLHDAVWCGRLLAAVGEPFPPDMLARIDAAAVWLWQVMEPMDGSVPCYGSNDGANFLKLDGGIYGDHRAAVQAALGLTRGMPVLPAGPWDETAAWLFGVGVLGQPRHAPERKNFVAPSAGYHVLRRAGTDVFIRCGPHRFRPHHADQLHVDLRRDGQPLTLDPGTFSYNAPPPWDHAFKNTRFHNTVSVDGLDQMDKAGRFLWLPWTSGTSAAVRELAEGAVHCWEGETDAWQRLAAPVRHRRAVLLHANGEVSVIDRLQSTGEHEYRLHWLLPDAQLEMTNGGLGACLTAPDHTIDSVEAAVTGAGARADWMRADEKSGRGWASPRYLERVPAWSWEITASGTTVWFGTHFGGATTAVAFIADTLRVGEATIVLGSDRDGPLLRDYQAKNFAS